MAGGMIRTHVAGGQEAHALWALPIWATGKLCRFLLETAIGWFQNRRWGGRMTPQAQRLIVLLLVIGYTAALPVLFASSLQSSYIAACSGTLLLGSACMWANSGLVFWRKRRAGEVLLDLGRTPTPRGIIAIGLLLSLGLALWALLTLHRYALWVALGYLAFAGYMVSQFVLPLVSPIRLHQRGLALPSHYIPWERIGSYDLHDSGVVDIHYRTWALFSGYPWEVTLHCPAGSREQLVVLLAYHVPWARRRRLG